jgi:hypothetical protein
MLSIHVDCRNQLRRRDCVFVGDFVERVPERGFKTDGCPAAADSN